MVKWRNSCFCCQAVGWKKRCWSVSCRLSGLQGSSCSMPLCHRSVCRQTVCHKALVTADQHPSLHPSLPPLHKVTCCYYQHCHTFATLPTTYASSWTRQILCFIGCTHSRCAGTCFTSAACCRVACTTERSESKPAVTSKGLQTLMMVIGTVDCKKHNHYTLFAAVLLTNSCQARSRKGKNYASVASHCASLHFTLCNAPTVSVDTML